MMKDIKLAVRLKFQEQDAVCRTVLTTLSLFANKTRFRILCALAQGEFCVNDLVEVVGTGKSPHISQQLKMLSLAGLIQSERRQKRVFYRLKDRRVKKIIHFLEKHYVNKDVSTK